jgi:hypothetical protein
MKENTQKFLREASEEEIHIFECIAGDALEALGYERVTFPFNAKYIAQFEEENKRLKEEIRRKMDREDLQRRELQASLLQEIQKRRLVLH